MNLLSQDIIDDKGNPGRNFALARQRTANSQGAYSLNPTRTGPYSKLPHPNTTYATGQHGNIPDPRFPDDLGNGPFQLSRYMAYSDFPRRSGPPLFPDVTTSRQQQQKGFVCMGRGDRGHRQPHDGFGTTPADTFQGGLAMSFFNTMADFYAISDNYHQPIMGGTGANFLALATGDAAFYNGYFDTPSMPNKRTVPPTSFMNQGTQTSQVENPNPQPAGSNTNWYTEDGYRGGSYVNCSDTTQPGVTPI
jgi:hypothetical protein